MERDFLRGFGLEENQINQILNENSKDIGKKVNEIKQLETEVNNYKSELEKVQGEVTTANATINNLKNSNKDNEALQNKIAEYKTKMDEMQKSFDLERKNNAIISELQKNDFIDPKLAIHLIDSDKVIKAQDGSYSGLTEQIDALMNNSQYDYLRNIQTETPEQTVPEIDRGGYDPASTTPNITGSTTEKESTLIGEVIGKAFEERQATATESAENFWNSL